MPTVKHGSGNTMVWECFCWDSIGPLRCIKSIMGQNVYLDKIKNVMLPHGEDKMPHVWIFQQDNDPKHSANSIKIFSIKKKLTFRLTFSNPRFKFNRTSLGTS